MISVRSFDGSLEKNKNEMSKEEEDNALLFSVVHDLMEEMKEVFKVAAVKKFPKEELMVAIKGKLRKYKKLKGTALHISVNNYIIKESEQNCSIQFEESELKNLW
jgi:hypothetical protein